MFFFKLPQIIQIELISSWFRVYEITRLDNALCSREYRREFLMAISHKFVTIQCKEFSPFYFKNNDPMCLYERNNEGLRLFNQQSRKKTRISNSLHFWLQKRGMIRVSSFILTNFNFGKYNFVGYETGSVTSIYIDDHVPGNFNVLLALTALPATEYNRISIVLNEFKNLTCLEISNGAYDSERILSKISTGNVANLNQLVIETKNNYPISKTFVALLNLKFKHLVCLKLRSGYIKNDINSQVSETEWTEFLSNSNLQCLVLQIQFWTISFAHSLTKCTQLLNLSLHCCLNVMADHLLEPIHVLLMNCPNLLTLNVTIGIPNAVIKITVQCVLPDELISISGPVNNNDLCSLFSKHIFRRISLATDGLEDDVLSTIGKCCTNLVRLCIDAKCGSKYSRAGITRLLLIPSLKLLLLHGCDNKIFVVSCVVVVSTCLNRECLVNIINSKNEQVNGLNLSLRTINNLRRLDLIDVNYLIDMADVRSNYTVSTVKWGEKSSHAIGFVHPLLPKYIVI
jgi:hypothetical protein